MNMMMMVLMVMTMMTMMMIKRGSPQDRQLFEGACPFASGICLSNYLIYVCERVSYEILNILVFLVQGKGKS
jgi:hypothetical protein